MLQEVHCSQENSHLWAAEWGYKSLFSSFSSSKAGVSILFNNNFDLQIMKTFIDDSGRLILCDLKTNGKSITLANIYAPNEDDPAFLRISLITLKISKERKLLLEAISISSLM